MSVCSEKPRCSILSFRLGGHDGVSVVAAQWARAFNDLGYETHTVAGEGDADSLLPWLGRHSTLRPDRRELQACLESSDLVVVENMLTIPLNVDASLAVADVLRGRPTVIHHHDPPWQRAAHSSCTVLPLDDACWRHVVLTKFTALEFEARGIRANTIYNGFEIPNQRDVAHARVRIRQLLAVMPDEVLLLHPVRAIERKNIPAALAMAEEIGGTYWLTGAAEDGYGPTLGELLAGSRVRILRQQVGANEMFGAYAAADAVLFPSTWEGFGNPALEASLSGKPVVVGRYPAAEEMRTLGFRWFDPSDAAGLADAIGSPDAAVLRSNSVLARRHFSHAAMRNEIEALLIETGWLNARRVRRCVRTPAPRLR